ncbi:MAG: nitric oxide synthase oxygenase [Planctomycetota bacterium]|nr:nitric oxide synthase oxygenase [Planctomycetota bacterium]
MQALEETETVSLDGTWFREACEQSPSLRALMDSLASMYLLPRRGVLALQTGSLDGRPSMTAVHSLPDGRRVVSTRLVGVAAFTSRRVGGGDPDETVRFDAAARGQFRELMLRERRLVGLHAEGEWPLLGEALGFLLDDVRLEAWQLALFRQRGEFRAEDPEPLYAESEELCACTHTTCGQIAQCLREGCHSVEEVAARTRATLVCGGCLPLVKELLGQADWTPARVVDSIPCTPEVRAFRLRPADAACREFRPGQHLVLQARIDNRWVQRAYTLTSAPGAEAYEITVKREPHGVFSRWLFDRLDSDSLLRLSPPNGAYTLPEDPARDVVCLVAGIGMTPALAFARSLERSPRAGRLHVDYSVSDEAQAVRAGELAQLHARHERLTFNLRVTGRVGRLGRREVHQLVEDYPEADFYLCGGEAYTESVRELLGLCGVPPERIKLEVFVDAGKPAPAAAAPGPAPAAAEAAPPPAHPREQARELLEAFYTEAGAREAFEARWPQVNGLFEFTGTYQQTAEELAYAARIAWRNSIRCIGRMYWRGLTVRDFRHVRSAEGMFEALFEHIELATNRGNLRPMMTVFAPLSVAGTGPRVWSPQLFRYAGYREADGRVLGDPANVELTEVARALGWEPPARRTPFDLLPLIVQAENDAPRWRAIPPELVLEVPIVHPQFAWFEDLQLKWYALPAVSCMRFDAGGVTYAAAPFNGWYMGTEIGARNFGDVARYNLLPVVAARMGLDTSNERTLWRDRALVELNAAVLHSYEKAGVTMMDHHAASHSFDKFEELERRAGRPVNAKWNWLVPPISGSAVTVFHKEGWPEVERIPNYFYQPDPWKTGSSWRRE